MQRNSHPQILGYSVACSQINQTYGGSHYNAEFFLKHFRTDQIKTPEPVNRYSCFSGFRNMNKNAQNILL